PRSRRAPAEAYGRTAPRTGPTRGDRQVRGATRRPARARSEDATAVSSGDLSEKRLIFLDSQFPSVINCDSVIRHHEAAPAGASWLGSERPSLLQGLRWDLPSGHLASC